MMAVVVVVVVLSSLELRRVGRVFWRVLLGVDACFGIKYGLGAINW